MQTQTHTRHTHRHTQTQTHTQTHTHTHTHTHTQMYRHMHKRLSKIWHRALFDPRLVVFRGPCGPQLKAAAAALLVKAPMATLTLTVAICPPTMQAGRTLFAHARADVIVVVW